MITISKSTKKETKKFNNFEWIDADKKYYGDGVAWISKNFVFKAEEEGKIAGCIIGKFEAGIVYVEDVIVAKDKRGLGIGQMLMEKAENYGREMKAHKIWLITGKAWPIRKFYEKLGFKNTGELLDHYKHQDFVIYEKIIN